MFPSGLAAQEGTIEKGDEVLSINGQTLRGFTHADATAALRQTRNLTLAVVVIGKRAEEEGGEGGNCGSEERSPAGEPCNTHSQPYKTVWMLRFSLTGQTLHRITFYQCFSKKWCSVYALSKLCG